MPIVVGVSAMKAGGQTSVRGLSFGCKYLIEKND
jgi:hypothetical protein